MSGVTFGIGAFFGFIGVIIGLYILCNLLMITFCVVYLMLLPFWFFYCQIRYGDNFNGDDTEFYIVMAVIAFILYCIYDAFSLNVVGMIWILFLGFSWLDSLKEKN